MVRSGMALRKVPIDKAFLLRFRRDPVVVANPTLRPGPKHPQCNPVHRRGFCKSKGRRSHMPAAQYYPERAAMSRAMHIEDWSSIPTPVDDGAALHLRLSRIASAALPPLNKGEVP
jgi:hypothetical protein